MTAQPPYAAIVGSEMATAATSGTRRMRAQRAMTPRQMADIGSRANATRTAEFDGEYHEGT